LTIPAEYFDGLYAESADPYGFGDRWYERRKRALTLAALPRERYRRAFEPGCSVGYLTRDLAARCDHVLACDVSPAAVDRARTRVRDCSNVVVEQRQLPRDWPAGVYDLVVLSELVYYFEDRECVDLLDRATTSLADDGTLVACHWRRAAEYPQSAESVHDALAARLAVVGGYSDADFLLTVYQPRSASVRSVAQSEGIV
jgi:SAM-dependent methyltransferase